MDRHADNLAYGPWKAMKSRCSNPNNVGFKNYGGRGITVCVRWVNSFDNFLKDLGDRPSRSHTLDRHPNKNGNYEPGNIRWATWDQQSRNKRNSRILEIDGKKQNLVDWSKDCGISDSVICERISRQKMSPKEAVSKPLEKRRMVHVVGGVPMSSKEAAAKLGIKISTLYARVYHDYPKPRPHKYNRKRRDEQQG